MQNPKSASRDDEVEGVLKYVAEAQAGEAAEQSLGALLCGAVAAGRNDESKDEADD